MTPERVGNDWGFLLRDYPNLERGSFAGTVSEWLDLLLDGARRRAAPLHEDNPHLLGLAALQTYLRDDLGLLVPDTGQHAPALPPLPAKLFDVPILLDPQLNPGLLMATVGMVHDNPNTAREVLVTRLKDGRVVYHRRGGTVLVNERGWDL